MYVKLWKKISRLAECNLQNSITEALIKEKRYEVPASLRGKTDLL